jgi:hypothetical protein
MNKQYAFESNKQLGHQGYLNIPKVKMGAEADDKR